MSVDGSDDGHGSGVLVSVTMVVVVVVKMKLEIKMTMIQGDDDVNKDSRNGKQSVLNRSRDIADYSL